MKLFDTFEAIKFPEENLIFITNRGYIYYIYNPKYENWRKHRAAGYDQLTVSNYPDASRDELVSAMQGVFPQKETDFMRLCPSSQLCIRDMLDLLREDYSRYMSDYDIYHAVHQLLLMSNICYKSFERVTGLLDNAAAHCYDNNRVLTQIKDLSLEIIGRDIFKEEIGIVDGHDSSSYFWIMPVRVIDYSNTNDIDNVAEMRSAEISIEELDVDQYLRPFLYKHFDDELEANRQRIEWQWVDDDGNEQTQTVNGFEWYLTHNYFTFESTDAILEDIRDTVDALSSGRENEYTAEIVNGGTEIEIILDFYRRFLYRMEYMLKVGKEKGYNLISFMGP